MSSFFRTTEPLLTAEQRAAMTEVDPWRAALGVLALVLVLGGVGAVWVGSDALGAYAGFHFGEDAGFDRAFTTSVVGGTAIVLGIAVGTVWLVLGAVHWQRER